MGQDMERTDPVAKAAGWDRRVNTLWWLAIASAVFVALAAAELWMHTGADLMAWMVVGACVGFVVLFRVLLNVLVQLLVLVEAHRTIAASLSALREELEAMRQGR